MKPFEDNDWLGQAELEYIEILSVDERGGFKVITGEWFGREIIGVEQKGQGSTACFDSLFAAELYIEHELEKADATSTEK